MSLDNIYPASPPLKNICPMTLSKPDGPYACAESQCHWWTTYYRGSKNEFSECCIKAISLLFDLAAAN